jgi:hypothetical protein
VWCSLLFTRHVKKLSNRPRPLPSELSTHQE